MGAELEGLLGEATVACAAGTLRFVRTRGGQDHAAAEECAHEERVGSHPRMCVWSIEEDHGRGRARGVLGRGRRSESPSVCVCVCVCVCVACQC